MSRINEHYRKLAAGYLFPEIGRRVKAFADAHPDAAIIRLGIGDVTLPLVPAVVDAMRRAVDEMGTAAGFRGYAPDTGYDFLLDAIREDDYASRGVAVEEIDVEPASSGGGRNYGWDVREGSSCFDEPPTPGEPLCSDASLVDPVHEYPHDALAPCNAVTGGVVYRGTALPQLVGQYLFGDFCTEQIWSFRWDGAGGTVGPVVERSVVADVSAIDAIGAITEDGAGEILIVDLGGELFRLVPEPDSTALALTSTLALLVVALGTFLKATEGN